MAWRGYEEACGYTACGSDKGTQTRKMDLFGLSKPYLQSAEMERDFQQREFPIKWEILNSEYNENFSSLKSSNCMFDPEKI